MNEPRSGPAPPSAGSGNGPLRAHGLLAKLGWALRSDAGPHQARNEDFAGVYAPTIPDDAWDRGPFFVVCDGLGEQGAGAVASRRAVEAALSAWAGPSPAPAPEALRAAADAANEAVWAVAKTRVLACMGTTFTALTLAGHEAVIAHIGYSRCYLVRGGMCTQLTADHERLHEAGCQTLAAEKPKGSAKSLQLLGTSDPDRPVPIDLFTAEVQAGDVFVVCSDGLSGAVASSELAEWASAVGSPAAPTVIEAAEELVDIALDTGASDNVTVLVVKVTTGQALPAAGVRRRFFRRGPFGSPFIRGI